MTTEVVNFRDVAEHWDRVTRQWDDPRYVYIGRRHYDNALPASPFANPYRIGKDGNRRQVIARYMDWLIRQPHLAVELRALRGKTLVCWCAPQPCHGDVLAKLIEQEDSD